MRSSSIVNPKLNPKDREIVKDCFGNFDGDRDAKNSKIQTIKENSQDDGRINEYSSVQNSSFKSLTLSPEMVAQLLTIFFC